MDTLEGFLKGYLSHRRRFLQDQEGNPPVKLGWAIFFLVVVELVLARRLYHDIGLGIRIVSDLVGTALLLLFFQALLVKITSEVGTFFQKKGSGKTTWTFFSIGLFPLLLFLPLTLLFWIGDFSPLLRLILFLFLLMRVLSNWRESIEITFEFNRLQSTLVIYSMVVFFLFIGVLFIYISLIQSLTDLFR